MWRRITAQNWNGEKIPESQAVALVKDKIRSETEARVFLLRFWRLLDIFNSKENCELQ
jgi:hypothetical protein